MIPPSERMRGPTLTRLWFYLGQIPFGFWLFGTMPAKPPAWLTDGPPIDPIISSPELARALWLVLLTLVSSGPFVWIDTARVRRRLSPRDLVAVLRMVLASRRGALMFVVLTVYLGYLVWFVGNGVPAGSYFVRIPLLIAAAVLMTVLLPPVAIVLANSSSASGRILETTARQLFPFRVVSLLDGRHLGPTMFANKNDNLRTIRGRSWRSVVHRLVDLTPLVVVDARASTPPVLEEIKYMMDPQRARRAVFIVNDDGGAPGLKESGIDARTAGLTLCTAGDLPQMLGRFLKTGAPKISAKAEHPETAELIRALGHQDPRVYEPALHALVALGPPAVDSLTRVLGNTREPWLRRKNAAVALGRMKSDVDPLGLLQALGDANRNVQQGAVWALGHRRVEEAARPLASLLDDSASSWFTRAAVVEALGHINTPETHRTLSTFATRIAHALQLVRRGEVDSTPDLQLLRDFVSRRQGASGGVADPGELARLMEMALSQMESKLTVLLGSRSA